MVRPCTLVLFGASGDLTQRMVMPAVVRLTRRGPLSPACRAIGYARSPMTDEEFRAPMPTAVLREVGPGGKSWTAFPGRMLYIAAEYASDDVQGYAELARRLRAFDLTPVESRQRRAFLVLKLAESAFEKEVVWGGDRRGHPTWGASESIRGHRCAFRKGFALCHHSFTPHEAPPLGHPPKHGWQTL